MKRYLISGAMMLISGLLITSCHDKMENEYISNPVTVKTEEFDKAFKEAFTSNIDPNQDWGFGSTKNRKASTRYANPNAADGNTAWALPADIGTEEREKVVAHFANKSNYTANVLPGYINYWVQHVDIGNHSYPAEPDNNGVSSTVRANDHMDKLVVMEGDNLIHVERFNASSGSKMFMQSSESRVFGWFNSNASEEITNRYLIQLIDGAYYVGFDFTSSAENHVVKPDGTYDDWIIKLVPGELKTDGTSETEQPDFTNEDKEDNTPDDDSTDDPEPNPAGQKDLMDETYEIHQVITRTEYFQKRRLLQFGRVFCEDLGANYASNHKDFDYNDVVFDAYLYRDELWKKTSSIKVKEVRKYEKEVLSRPATDDEGKTIYRNKKQTVNGVEVDVVDANGNIEQEVVWENYNALVYKESEAKNEENGLPIWERVSSKDEITSYKLDPDGRGRRYYADILLMACGATKPIKVGAQRDGTPVKEVHEAFGGYSVDCIINTFDSHSEREGGFGYHELANPVRLEEMEIPIQYITVENPTIKDIPIFIQGGATEARTLEAQQGGIPQKFMSTNQDKWTSERCFLGDAYPRFNNWAENKDVVYSDGSNPEHLYNGSFPSCEQNILPFNVATGAASTICKNVILKVDTSEDDVTLVEYEVIGGGDFNELTAESNPDRYEVIEDITKVNYSTTPAPVVKAPVNTDNNNSITLYEYTKTWDGDESVGARFWEGGHTRWGSNTIDWNTVPAGSKVKIYGMPAESNWYIRPTTLWGYGVSFVNYNSGNSAVNASNVNNFGNDRCIVFEFNAETGPKLGGEGNAFDVDIQHYYVSKVVLEKKNN